MTSSVSSPDQAAAGMRSTWLQMLGVLKNQIPHSQFITWFKDTAILNREGGTLMIGLPLPMSLNWHMEHYRAVTLQVAQEMDPTITQIVYKVDGGLKDDRSRTFDLLEAFPEEKKRKLPGKQEVKLAEGIVSKILNPRYSLESFVVGSNNRLAYAACQAVAMQPGGKYNPLFLYGGVGLGKTHLLQATGNAILKQMPKSTVVYTTAEDFANQVIETVMNQKWEQFRRRYRSVDVLIIDDVQFLANKERTQEEFFYTFNTLYEERKQIILSADRPPQELQLEDRLVSRFERGMIADVSLPDYETRLAILVEKAKEYEIFMDMVVLQFIAEHATKHIRELEGILMQAVAQYELEQRMPTVKSIAEIMRKLNKDPHEREETPGFESVAARNTTFQDVMESVSRYYSVSTADMLGQSRVREILIPRQIAMFLCKKYLRLSYVRIGELFSGRDHTTVMNAMAKMESRQLNDPQLLREIRALEGELKLA